MLQDISQLQAVRNQEGIFIMGGLLDNYLIHDSVLPLKCLILTSESKIMGQGHYLVPDGNFFCLFVLYLSLGICSPS